jgi:hypothetical protein
MSGQPSPHEIGQEEIGQEDTGGAPPLPFRRLVSWNLLEGMLLPQAGGETERRTPDESRRRAAVTLIKRLEPDILVLNEALYCEEVFGQVENYADLFGFPHATNRLTMVPGETPFSAGSRPPMSWRLRSTGRAPPRTVACWPSG